MKLILNLNVLLILDVNLIKKKLFRQGLIAVSELINFYLYYHNFMIKLFIFINFICY